MSWGEGNFNLHVKRAKRKVADESKDKKEGRLQANRKVTLAQEGRAQRDYRLRKREKLRLSAKIKKSKE